MWFFVYIEYAQSPPFNAHADVSGKTRHMSRDMRFPTMWYVRPAKPQISLRKIAV